MRTYNTRGSSGPSRRGGTAEPEGQGPQRKDNTTAHAAQDYEAEVVRTIPFHEDILRTAVDVGLLTGPGPRRWLDTGCGPGKLAWMVCEVAPEVDVWMADPSAAMLDLARQRNPQVPPDHFFPCGTQDLPEVPARFDIITAVQSHHYLDVAGRRRAVGRCHAVLRAGGVLVVFENVRAESDAGHAFELRRLAAWQRRAGRSEEEIARHLAREGTAFFPIRPSEHLALFTEAGFDPELVWRTYNQAGFVCWRR